MGEVNLHHPGIIFACTDGLTDVTNDADAYFDDNNISEILKDAEQFTSAEMLNEALMKDVDLFRGKKPYPDDIALLTCKYTVEAK